MDVGSKAGAAEESCRLGKPFRASNSKAARHERHSRPVMVPERAELESSIDI